MVGKIPPHVASELRRHIISKQGGHSTSTWSWSSFSLSSSSLPKVLAGCFILTATMTIVPYIFMHKIRPLNDREEALTGSQIRRGAFNNSGSRDAGKDPYWDFKRGRRKKIGEDGCDDDGGYEELFRRDDPRKVELGDEYKRKTR